MWQGRHISASLSHICRGSLLGEHSLEFLFPFCYCFTPSWVAITHIPAATTAQIGDTDPTLPIVIANLRRIRRSSRMRRVWDSSRCNLHIKLLIWVKVLRKILFDDLLSHGSKWAIATLSIRLMLVHLLSISSMRFFWFDALLGFFVSLAWFSHYKILHVSVELSNSMPFVHGIVILPSFQRTYNRFPRQPSIWHSRWLPVRSPFSPVREITLVPCANSLSIIV